MDMEYILPCPPIEQLTKNSTSVLESPSKSIVKLVVIHDAEGEMELRVVSENGTK
jgi:hypothetical protein